MSAEIKSGSEEEAVTRQAVGPVLPSCPVCREPIGGARRDGGRVTEDGPLTPLVCTALPCGCPLDPYQYNALAALLRAAARPLWRFDVPEVPEHVTCLKSVDSDGDEHLWVRTEADTWAVVWQGAVAWIDTTGHPLRSLLAYAPLVECPDPRKDPA